MAASETPGTGTQCLEAIEHQRLTERSTDRATEIGIDLSARRRGALDLGRDMSHHRRHAWLYDDLLT